MLLPHAYEGQGPEHSSARLERYLLQCAQGNIQVANCSTPANYFHILRRQVVRHVRKPLVLMTPKSLLRHPACVSDLQELQDGEFRHVIPDPRELPADEIRRVVFCSGHVYYDLLAVYDDYPDAKHIAVHRVELLYPFPHEQIVALIEAAPGAEVMWVQEEPSNMGAWPVIANWLRDHMPEGRTLSSVTRPEAASPATGSHSIHKREQLNIVRCSLTL
jgi:2-oxoglutarate dehydrogenase E1 component